jgi:mRNA-degrading endonuclease toxin of MazEF toxin-antitoxin module
MVHSPNMNPLESFTTWLTRKFALNSLERIYRIKEGEVYWCSLGINVGDEENGKGVNFRRPVLIFKKFNNNIFLAIPLSTKNKENKYYVPVTVKDVMQSAMISQIRILDTKRLDEKVGYISKSDFENVRARVIEMISK